MSIISVEEVQRAKLHINYEQYELLRNTLRQWYANLKLKSKSFIKISQNILLPQKGDKNSKNLRKKSSSLGYSKLPFLIVLH